MIRVIIATVLATLLSTPAALAFNPQPDPPGKQAKNQNQNRRLLPAIRRSNKLHNPRSDKTLNSGKQTRVRGNDGKGNSPGQKVGNAIPPGFHDSPGEKVGNAIPPGFHNNPLGDRALNFGRAPNKSK
jgi:hypothetical protein